MTEKDKSPYVFRNHIDNLVDWALDKIEIQLGRRCNLTCQTCFGRYMRRLTEPEIGLDVWVENVLKPLARDWPKTFIPVAGCYSDPALYAGAWDVIWTMVGLDLRFGFYTNGMVFPKEAFQAFNRISIAGCFASFDIAALVEFNEFENVLPTIAKLCGMAGRQFKVYAPVLLTPQVEPRLMEVHTWLLDAGVDRVRYVFPQVPVNPRKEEAILAILGELGEDSRASIQTKFFDRCYVMRSAISIAANGGVYPCSQVCSGDFEKWRIGSVVDTPITEIWGSPEHRVIAAQFDPQLVACRCDAVDRQINERRGQVK